MTVLDRAERVNARAGRTNARAAGPSGRSRHAGRPSREWYLAGVPDGHDHGHGGHRTGHRARLVDVAREAGVSPITVSRALREPHRVAPGTRATIDDAIARVGYIPNRLAGSLVTRRTHAVAAILPTLDNSIFTEVLSGMMSVLRPEGYQLILGNSAYSLHEEEMLISEFLGRQVDGLVLTGTTHTRRARALLDNAGVPIVETWTLAEAPIDSGVGFSNFEASKAMTTHLLQRGYRRVGFVSAPVRDNERATARRDGFVAAMAERDLSVPAARLLESSFGLRQGADALDVLTRRTPDLEAIFCANDVLAAGALLECVRRGWPVPGRMAVAGFDDLELASQVTPALTTVRIDRQRIGTETAHLLLARLTGQEPAPSQRIDVGFTLKRRAST